MVISKSKVLSSSFVDRQRCFLYHSQKSEGSSIAYIIEERGEVMMFPLGGGTVSVVWQWVASSSGFYNAAGDSVCLLGGKVGFLCNLGKRLGLGFKPFF